MAVLKEGINGGFSGKAGAVVGYYRFGKAIMRGLPKSSAKNKRGSTKQKESRSRFAKMQHVLSPTLSFIRVGYNIDARSRQVTAHNAAKSYNMLNAFTADNEIDFSKLLLTFGELRGSLDATVQSDDAGLHFSWVNNSEQGVAHARDQVMLLAYDDENLDSQKKHAPKAFYLLSGARRNAELETLEIPLPFKGHTLHTYIAFISDDRERISMSTYVGEIVY